VAHRTRAEHKARHPTHLTLRAGRQAPNLRQQVVFFEVRRALRRASRAWFRVVHFSVQNDHIHLLVEAHDKLAIARGVAGFAVRVARRVNRLVGRRGRFWGDRYHVRDVRTPREVRNAIVYVVMNWQKHVRRARGMDPCSSAFWLDGWKVPPSEGPPVWNEETAPVRRPKTWLAREGWRRHGLIGRDERPMLAE
jgi:REP element-mobilizing transposase RayT